MLYKISKETLHKRGIEAIEDLELDKGEVEVHKRYCVIGREYVENFASTAALTQSLLTMFNSKDYKLMSRMDNLVSELKRVLYGD